MYGAFGASSSMKFWTPVMPTSTAAVSDSPRQGKKRAPTVKIVGTSVSFARQLSPLGFFVWHA